MLGDIWESKLGKVKVILWNWCCGRTAVFHKVSSYFLYSTVHPGISKSFGISFNSVAERVVEFTWSGTLFGNPERIEMPAPSSPPCN